MSRRRAHAATVGVPIVSPVLPSPALIRELVDRGHRVTCANDPFVADRIESAGVAGRRPGRGRHPARC
jgi:UDP:flavonoid glycosyltransferase YjiC (YdhE family)